MKRLIAGETMKLSCPDGSVASPGVGDKIPKDDAFFFVMSKEGSLIELGPLKAGETELSVACSDGSVITENITIEALRQKPQKQSSLGTLTLDVPTWFIVVLVLTLLLPIILYAYRHFRRRLAKKKVIQKKRELSFVEVFEKELRKAKGKSFIEESQQRRVKDQYTELVHLLRNAVDKSFKMNTEFFTSSEFMATLRPLGQRKGLGAEKLSTMESLLLRSDQVRFAKYSPNAQERQIWVEDVEKIFSTLRPHLVEKKKQEAKSGTRKS